MSSNGASKTVSVEMVRDPLRLMVSWSVAFSFLASTPESASSQELRPSAPACADSNSVEYRRRLPVVIRIADGAPIDARQAIRLGALLAGLCLEVVSGQGANSLARSALLSVAGTHASSYELATELRSFGHARPECANPRAAIAPGDRPVMFGALIVAAMEAFGRCVDRSQGERDPDSTQNNGAKFAPPPGIPPQPTARAGRFRPTSPRFDLSAKASGQPPWAGSYFGRVD